MQKDKFGKSVSSKKDVADGGRVAIAIRKYHRAVVRLVKQLGYFNASSERGVGYHAALTDLLVALAKRAK